MANRIHQLVLTLALTGLAGAVLAQTGPDSGAPDSSPPGGPHPQHGWQGGPGGPDDHGKWGEGNWGQGREGYGHEGDHGWHGHHHHRHHHRWHGHWGHGGPGGGWQGRGHGPGMMMSFRWLDLTPAQREQIHTIMSGAWQESMKKRQNGATDMIALGNPGDPGYTAAVQAAKKRAADRIQEGSDLQLKLYNVLTPAQKAQLTKDFAERKAKMAEWKTKMDKWKADHAQGQPVGPGNP